MRRKKEVTLTDIAREVGVSTMTVSAVLNGSKSTVRVSEQTSLKVREAATRLSYGANRGSGKMSRRRTNAIGVIAEFNHPGTTNVVLLQLLDGILEGCAVSGQRTIIYPVSMWSTDEKSIISFCDEAVDGFVFLGPRLSPETARYFYRSTPFIAVHNAGSIAGAINIDTDNEYGAYIGTKYLIDLGHKHIAHVMGAPIRSGTDERTEGYKRALKEADIALNQDYLLRGFYSIGSGMDAADHFVEKFKSGVRPTAVFCANDASACGFIGKLRTHGMRVPEDVSVIGFDDSLFAGLPVLELTTLRQPLRSMGSHALSVLLQNIDLKSGEPGRVRETVMVHNGPDHFRNLEGIQTLPDKIIFQPKLIVRQTTAPPA